MKDTAFQKLRWVKPAPQVEAAISHGAMVSHAAALRAAIQKVGLPKPPQSMSVADEVRFLLKAVAEVEHALLVQYLYAAYSIPATGGLSVHRRKLVTIAIEEMGHLITAQNLLIVLGAPLYFNREDTIFGQKPAGDFPFPIRLEPVSLDSLAKYVTAESPPLELIGDPALRARLEPVFQQAEHKAGRMVNHVGVLFAYIFWLFQPSDEPHPLWPDLPADLMPSGRHLADSDFNTAGEPRQAMPEEFFGAGDNVFIFPILSRDDALAALDKIAQQGEGWNMGQASHFERFLDTYEKFAPELSGHILNVPVNPSTSDADDDPAIEQGRISHEAALRWARLLNARYRLVLLELSLAMLQPREPDDGGVLSRSSLIISSVSTEMKRGIRDIAKRLSELPRHPDSPAGEVAGAPFELPENSFPADETAIRQKIREDLLRAGQLMQELENLPAPNSPSASDLSLIEQLRSDDGFLLQALDA